MTDPLEEQAEEVGKEAPLSETEQAHNEELLKKEFPQDAPKPDESIQEYLDRQPKPGHPMHIDLNASAPKK